MLSEAFLRDRAEYLNDKFQRPSFPPDSGQDNDALGRNLAALVEELDGLPHPIVKARAFEYVTRNVRIDVSPHDWFVGFGCWDRRARPLNRLVRKWDLDVNERHLRLGPLMDALSTSGATIIWKDFDHSAPDWDAVHALGFPGLRERARQYRREREAHGEMSAPARAFFDGIEITYSAILEMIERFRAQALARADDDERMPQIAACLDSLVHGAPGNTYEALHLVYLLFMFGEYIDRYQVRSLGNLDRDLFPYYQNDLRSGRFTREQIRELFAYFLMQWASIANYWGHPFYLGGTKANGESEINDLSFLILDVFDELRIPTPKIQLKIAPNTPVEFLDKALDMIRRGHSSLVFVCEPGMRHALMALGASEEEARTCDITGCYEFIPRGRGNATCAGHLNMLKFVELVFHNGVDPQTGLQVGCETGELEDLHTFERFAAAYLRQMDHVIEANIRCAVEFEPYLSYISPAQVYSATIEHSLEVARDAFENGSVYNLSMLLQAGFATAVDALMVVKEFVYEKGLVSLTDFRRILADNWQGHEKLRLRALRTRRKFGNGIEEVDALAESIANHMAERINGRPNGRNGIFIASVHSARMFIVLGGKTGATPDGRLAGEEMSKNISPTMGMDVNGVTALIRSATRIDSQRFPGDFALDVMMLPSTVQGEEGLAAMRVLLNAYMKREGLAIQFNIFDAQTLRDAQAHPEKYEGLQIRVCGWNVRWNDIAKKEQDAYILRAEGIDG